MKINNKVSKIGIDKGDAFMQKSVIVAGARTPFGKFGGTLRARTASQLGGVAIKAAIERANVEDEHIDEVIMGNVLQGGQGQLPSRQAAREAGISHNHFINIDRKSTRLNSSHVAISYAVFCLKKKTNTASDASA